MIFGLALLGPFGLTGCGGADAELHLRPQVAGALSRTLLVQRASVRIERIELHHPDGRSFELLDAPVRVWSDAALGLQLPEGVHLGPSALPITAYLAAEEGGDAMSFDVQVQDPDVDPAKPRGDDDEVQDPDVDPATCVQDPDVDPAKCMRMAYLISLSEAETINGTMSAEGVIELPAIMPRGALPLNLERRLLQAQASAR